MKYNFFELITALITPYKNNKIDYKALKKIIIYQRLCGINSFVLFGTTGEGELISLNEKIKIIKKLKKEFQDIYLIVGVSKTSTELAIYEAKKLSLLNIDALLVLTPYYIKTNDQGIILHYEEICENVNIPIYIYDVINRTGQNLSVEVIHQLSKNKKILGIKECSTLKLYNQCLSLQEKNFQVYCGDDMLIINALENKGMGLISVASNAYPKTMLKIINLFLDNKKEEAKDLFEKYEKSFSLLFNEPNPIPIKYLMNKIGFSTLSYRLPLYYPSKELINQIEEQFIGDL